MKADQGSFIPHRSQVAGLLPQLRIARCALDGRKPQKSAVTVVNRIVCVVCDRDEKLGIDDIGMTTVQVLWSQRVHVVYENFVMNRETIDPEDITAISSNYVMAN